MSTDPVTPSSASPDCGLSRRLPRTAYVLLWFPLSSETFIFREVQRLAALGMPLRVYTMYGKQLRGSSEEMRRCPLPVMRLGTRATFRILGAFFRALRRDPGAVWKLMREGLFRRMRNLEALGENVWCFLAGFLLAEQARRDQVELLHSAWGNGCATAVWVASRASGIPFAFTGRAGDIYPQDGILREKCRDALFIRTNNMANVPWLQSFCPDDEQDKVHAVYNGLTLAQSPAHGMRDALHTPLSPAGGGALLPHQGLSRTADHDGPPAPGRAPRPAHSGRRRRLAAQAARHAPPPGSRRGGGHAGFRAQ